MRMMLCVLAAVGVLCVVTSAARSADKPPAATPKVVIWEKNLEAAFQKSITAGKPLVVVFLCPLEDEKCVHCKRFRGALFSDEFGALAGDAVFVQVCVVPIKGAKTPDELGQRLFEKLGAKATPTVSILEPNPRVVAELGRMNGYFDGVKLAGHVRDFVGKWVKDGRKLTESSDK